MQISRKPNWEFQIISFQLRTKGGTGDRILVNSLTLQRNHWSGEPWSDQVTASVASSQTAQDYKESAKAEGGVRLRNQLSEKCVQHSHCLSPLSFHLRCHRGPIVQWKILLLQ